MTDTMRHFLDLADLTAAELRAIIDAAHIRKKNRAGLPNGTRDADAPLDGYILAMVFDKPSTRTRVSFDLAMRQLGGQTIILNQNEMQLGRGEALSDTARVLSGYVDAMVVRTGRHENIMELAKYASIPVINGLTALSHPCQIVADIMTFEEHKGAIAGHKIAWMGDGNNVAVSWIHAATLLGFELHLATAHEFRPPEAIIERALSKGAKLIVDDDVKGAAKNASLINTDCWVSMSDDLATAAKRAEAFKPFQVTQELMALGNDPLFMHCLPAYRGNEVVSDVIDSPASVVFDEAANRNHAQKAILTWCLGQA